MRLSAGTGPAASILGGVALYMTGYTTLGTWLVIAGICLSLVWALR